MNYELRHKDSILLKFSATENSNEPEIEIFWQNTELQYLLPLDLTVSEGGLSKWLKHRTIPKNRAYVHSFLSKCGMNINRPMNIIKLSKGLSVNDCYWIVEDGFDGLYDKYNLYENNFSRILALIAFTGYGSSIRTSLASCPEFTINGMLPKCWRRISGKIMLYKGGTKGASNAGNEPYSEFYAAQIAEKLGINAIPYGLSKWKGELCSTCELFTSKELSFIPIGRIVTRGGIAAVRAYYESLGQEFVDALNDMIVLDAIICNSDRHFGNLGVMEASQNNKESPEIILEMVSANTQLRIRVKNKIQKSILNTNPYLRTTKSVPKKHGYGISILKEIASRYDGSTDFFEEDSYFIAQIVLYTSAENTNDLKELVYK